MHICKYCGKDFEGRKKKFCSVECRDSNRRRELGILPIDERLQVRKKAQVERFGRSCEWCGCSFILKSGGRNTDTSGRFCSLLCYGEWRRSGPAKVRFSKVSFSRCRWCGRWYRKSNNNTFCSKDCSVLFRRDCARARSIETTRDARVVNCKCCGVSFTRLYGSRSSFCSDECQIENKKRWRRRGKQVRRARKRGGGTVEHFDPFLVLDRDGWRCQHCGRKAPKRHRGTFKDSAPELDHIIPLSVGGLHTQVNTQCLCRKCNIEKGNGVLDDQMILLVG